MWEWALWRQAEFSFRVETIQMFYLVFAFFSGDHAIVLLLKAGFTVNFGG